MDMNSTLARLATGLAVRLIAGGLAIYAATSAWHYVAHVFASVKGAF